MQPAIGGLTPTSISRDRTLLSGVEQAARPMPSISTGARATAVGFIGGHTLSSASWWSKAERQENERPPVWPDHAAPAIPCGELGRASCMERVCTYVKLLAVTGSFNNKKISNNKTHHI